MVEASTDPLQKAVVEGRRLTRYGMILRI